MENNNVNNDGSENHSLTALRAEMARLRPALLRAARKVTRTAEDAEDLTQDVLLQACRRAETFHYRRGSDSLLPWLLAILHNTNCNHYRERKRRGEWESAGWEGIADDRARGLPGTPVALPPESAVLRRGEMTAVFAALDRVPDRYREPLALAVWEELSYEEIGARLRLPVGTVRSRIHRGRSRVARAAAAWLSGGEGRA
jgi:RNA polymerase sigma-70 factor, ECF subfamily